MRRVISGAVVLALSIALPATIHGARFLIALWIFIAVAGLGLMLSPFAKKLPWEIRRKNGAALPEWVERLPYYLNPFNSPRQVANFLIEYGHGVVKRIPESEPPSELIQALAKAPPGLDHVKEVAYWEHDVKTFLDSRARDCRALFRDRDHVPRTHAGLRKYMLARIDELKAVHGRLGD
jgi:hypothetical protein